MDRLEEFRDKQTAETHDHSVRLKVLEGKFDDLKTRMDDLNWWQKAAVLFGGAGTASAAAVGVAQNVRRRRKEDETP